MRNMDKAKGKTALAFAVSLWMAGGTLFAPSPASAQNSTVTDDNHTKPTQIIYGNNSGNISLPTPPVIDNTIAVQLTNNQVGCVYGALFYDNDDVVSGNTVKIISGQVDKAVIGGVAYGGPATGNQVVISGGKIADGSSDSDVSGAVSAEGDVTENRVTITGGTVAVTEGIFGGRSEQAAANNNIVEISGGTINSRIFGGATSRFGTGSASDNKVVVTGGTIGGRQATAYTAAIPKTARRRATPL